LEAGEYEVRVIPKPKNLMEMMLSDLVGTSEEDEGQIQVHRLWQLQPVWQAFGSLMEHLQPQRSDALRRAIVQLEILHREGVTLATPEFVFE
jgi:hypothetical protein